MISPRPFENGFTLMEVTLSLLLLAVLATLVARAVGDGQDAVRFEQSKAKLQAIRAAVLGSGADPSDALVPDFGYHGDMGRLPARLEDLVRPESPAYTFDRVRGIGAGWRGPYYRAGFPAADPVSVDAWGRPFAYRPDANPPYVECLGSDGAPGGTGFASDIRVTLPAQSRLAKVQGILSSERGRLAGATVELRYPVGGVAASFTVKSSAQGFFEFENVPFGARSLSLGKETATVLVDRPVVLLSDATLAGGTP